MGALLDSLNVGHWVIIWFIVAVLVVIGCYLYAKGY